MGELEKQLESIQDLVLVDDKIVTFKLVSKVLKVHTNKAKQLLFAFVQSPDFSEKVSATYLIGGENSEKELKYLVVKSDEIENAKKNFDTVLTEHVFSVQRNPNLSGTDLYNADVSFGINEEDRKFSSIQANDDIKIRNVPNFIPLPKNDEASKEPKGKAKTEPLKPVQEKESKMDEKKPSPVKEAPKKASPKKPNKKAVAAKGGGIGAMFSRQVSNAKPKETKETEKECKENIEVKQDKIDVKEKDEPEVKKKKSESKKKRKKSKDGDSKKRKRIKIASDSESSAEEMDYQEEAPPTPEQEIPALADSDDEVIPPTPEVNCRKRVRKQVDKNFVDEEGFLHTKKEFVYESCSDDEANKSEEKVETVEKPKKLKEDVIPSETPKEEKTIEKPKTDEKSPTKEKKKPGRPKAKAPSPQKNKQRSITSFFQKK